MWPELVLQDTVGLRSFAAGGKLLQVPLTLQSDTSIDNTKVLLWKLKVVVCVQINRRMEFVFASHSFDVWESWSLEGSLDECRLVNCRNSSVSLCPCTKWPEIEKL